MIQGGRSCALKLAGVIVVVAFLCGCLESSSNLVREHLTLPYRGERVEFAAPEKDKPLEWKSASLSSKMPGFYLMDDRQMPAFFGFASLRKVLGSTSQLHEKVGEDYLVVGYFPAGTLRENVSSFHYAIGRHTANSNWLRIDAIDVGALIDRVRSSACIQDQSEACVALVLREVGVASVGDKSALNFTSSKGLRSFLGWLYSGIDGSGASVPYVESHHGPMMWVRRAQ